MNTLKIDSVFTRWLGNGSKNCEIVHTIVRLAKALGMSVVAEGVETDLQLQKLAEINCQYVQGFLLSEPLGCDAAGEMLVRNRKIYQPAKIHS